MGGTYINAGYPHTPCQNPERGPILAHVVVGWGRGERPFSSSPNFAAG